MTYVAISSSALMFEFFFLPIIQNIFFSNSYMHSKRYFTTYTVHKKD